MLKKLGYKWHLLVKNPKLWIYKCKINFYKCKLTCDKKLCQVIHSRSEICWKKPKYAKKMSFWRNIFLPNLPCLSPCRERSKVERPQILFFLTLFPYFFGVGSKKSPYEKLASARGMCKKKILKNFNFFNKSHYGYG